MKSNIHLAIILKLVYISSRYILIYFLGINENSQLEALTDMRELVNNMYFHSSSDKLVQKPFQCGILISIESTISLYKELREEGASFLLTSRVNQEIWGKYG